MKYGCNTVLPMSPEQIVLSFGPDEDDTEKTERTILLPQGFPYFELKTLGEVLEKNDVFVPGYIPPSVGLYIPDGFIYENQFRGIDTLLLPDRDIVSRMAKIASGAPMESMLQKAAAVKAFCHYLDIQIEPSLAFHEQAQSEGNVKANEELAWFRSADNAEPAPWVELALGTSKSLKAALHPYLTKSYDFTFPLKRWRRNYIAALKIAEIELIGGPNLDRMLKLIHWMKSDFIVAGPAALMGCIYYAPNSPPKAGLFKSLRSSDRNKAIKGIRNATWDLTHLSDFIRRVNEAESGTTRFLFASFDEGLRNLAKLLLICFTNTLNHERIADAISAWWPRKHAIHIAEALIDLLVCIDDKKRKYRQSTSPITIGDMITRGEMSVISFTGDISNHN